MVVGESRTELLQWINTILDLNYTKIEQCGTGAAFCQLMDSIVGGVPLNKVKFNANTEYAYRHNWKILQLEFIKHRITKNIDVERLIKCRLQDNLELLQWFKRYWNENADVHNQYDALSKRNGVGTGTVNNSPYNTVSLIPTVNGNSTLRQQQQQQSLAPPGSITRKRQISQSPGLMNTTQSHNGYNSDQNMQFGDKVNTQNESSPQPQPSQDALLSSNYTSSTMSAKVRPRKSVTPTTSSRNSTPIQRPRKTSDRQVKRVSSQGNGNGIMGNVASDESLSNGRYKSLVTLGGGGAAVAMNSSVSDNTSSSFQTTTSATAIPYTSTNEHQHHEVQAHASNRNGSSINEGYNNGYQITNEEVEIILDKNSQLENQLNEYKLNCDTLQVERNFYFNKCRDIEILIQNIEHNETLMSELDVLTLLKKIEDTLYATQEGFSSEVHHVAGDDHMLDSEF